LRQWAHGFWSMRLGIRRPVRGCRFARCERHWPQRCYDYKSRGQWRS